MINLAIPNLSLGDFLAPISNGIQSVITQIKRASNPKKVWQEECKKSYDAKDWNRLWWVMKTGATGAPFAGMPVAAYFLDRYLTKGGYLKLDYTFAFPGQSNWISQAPSVKNIVAKLDMQAKTRILNDVKSGKQNGVFTNKESVITKGDVDGDCYYAIGKFILNGEYKFNVEKNIFGQRYVKIERVYWTKEPYDWTPGAKGGILPHDYPIALANNGKAAVYTYEIKFGEPEFKVNF